VQLNPDTIVYPGAFDCLVQFMEENPEAGICTPKVLNRDGTLQKQCRRSAARPWDAVTYFSGLSRRFPQSRLLARYLMTYLNEDEVNEIEAVSGSCMIIRREVVEQIGYLDEQFFAYQEDADFCFRARQAAGKSFTFPGADRSLGGEGGSKVQVYQSIYQWHVLTICIIVNICPRLFFPAELAHLHSHWGETGDIHARHPLAQR
jgi:cellulose synthase/poly-beta-1,6-N-acetylglucosamine synthase-like glycosyltransferase